jgi:hypothetical protein
MAALAHDFICEKRGAIEVKGVGLIEAWLVKAERGPGIRERSA